MCVANCAVGIVVVVAARALPITGFERQRRAMGIATFEPACVVMVPTVTTEPIPRFDFFLKWTQFLTVGVCAKHLTAQIQVRTARALPRPLVRQSAAVRLRILVQ